MKIRERLLLPLVCLLVASVARAGSLPPIEVSVSNSGGKVVFKGTTKADGTFTTGNLAPGNYVVLFVSKNGAAKGGPFAIEASAGKIRMSANSLPGQRFADPGVRMKINVAAASAMTGRIGAAGSLKAAPMAKASQAQVNDDRPTKMINGKRCVWVRPQTSSLEGGHWVEVGSAEDTEAPGAKSGGVRTIQHQSGRGY